MLFAAAISLLTSDQTERGAAGFFGPVLECFQ